MVLATDRGRYDRLGDDLRAARADDPAGRGSRADDPASCSCCSPPALFAIGLYGALSQQSIVMLMMGLELMLNGVIVAAAAFWYYVAPGGTDGQVLIVVVITAMAIEMAVGFAVVTAIYRARQVDMTDDAADLRG